MKIVGYLHKTGSYQGKSYDNYHVFTSFPITSDNGSGFQVEILKVNNKIFNEFVSAFAKDANADNIIGLVIEPSYNKYGQIAKIFLSK